MWSYLDNPLKCGWSQGLGRKEVAISNQPRGACLCCEGGLAWTMILSIPKSLPSGVHRSGLTLWFNFPLFSYCWIRSIQIATDWSYKEICISHNLYSCNKLFISTYWLRRWMIDLDGKVKIPTFPSIVKIKKNNKNKSNFAVLCSFQSNLAWGELKVYFSLSFFLLLINSWST